MELDDLFDQPRRRRWWLLVKGLEYGNLEEALEFARAADDFVSTAPANLEVSPSLAMLDPSVSPLVSEPNLGKTKLPHTESTVGEPNLSLCDSSSAALASTDDVVRYLRQRDDVVVAAEEGKLLVNGRFRLNPSELVIRANRMRERQGKPRFELIGQTITAVMNGHTVAGDIVPIQGSHLLPARDANSPPIAPVALEPARCSTSRRTLTPRETEILGCLSGGCSNKMIARQLGIAEATVKVHLKSLLRKIKVANRTQAAIWAVNN